MLITSVGMLMMIFNFIICFLVNEIAEMVGPVAVKMLLSFL
jgi:hypothetical protein